MKKFNISCDVRKILEESFSNECDQTIAAGEISAHAFEDAENSLVSYCEQIEKAAETEIQQWKQYAEDLNDWHNNFEAMKAKDELAAWCARPNKPGYEFANND